MRKIRAIMKYPGSKWSMANWIINFFPAHHSYLEPFFGSGAVLFNKQRSNIETINDLDSRVVNLFECIKSDPEKLARLIYLTPYSREVYEKAYKENPQDRFEMALNFYIKLNMGHGFRTTGEKVGWKNDVQGRERAYAAKNWHDLPEMLLETAERLRGVQIENRPAIELMDRFNYKNVLISLDPPYMPETRHGKQYKCEMYDYASHEKLLEVAKAHKDPVLISGYDTELYNDMLRSWHKEETTSYSQVCSKKREILWMNYEPQGKQLTLEDIAWKEGEKNE